MSSTSALRLLISIFVLAWAGTDLAGCKKDSTSTGPDGSAGPAVNVTGKVVLNTGLPASGVPVYVTGQPSVNTDANGAFTFSNVTVPYDVTVVDADAKQVYIYRGITRSNPTLLSLGVSSSSLSHATVSGNLYPASAFPQPATRIACCGFVSSEYVGAALADGSASPGSYTIAPWWYGAASITGTLYALQWNLDPSGLPVSYQRYGLRSGIIVTDGGTFAGVNDTMTSTPATLTFAGSITVPAGYTISSKSVTAQFGGKAVIPLAEELSSVAAYSFKMPDIAGMTLVLEVTAYKSGVGETTVYKTGLSPGTTGATINVLPVPELSLPVDNATGVRAGAKFSWNAYPGGVHVLGLNGPVGQPSFYIVTMAASDSLPNLASAGLPIPSSVAYKWRVNAFSPFASMDDVTGSASGFLPRSHSGLYIGTSGGSAGASFRSFTTAP